jgi:hypothetical protein
MFVSSINGLQFTGAGGSISSNLALSNLTTSSLFTNYVSSKTILVDNISVGTITVFGPSTLNVQGSANFSKGISLSNFTPGFSTQSYVAGGSVIQTSTDGSNWTTNGFNLGGNVVTSMANNASMWVGTVRDPPLGTSSIIHSTDSQSWSYATSLGFGPGQFTNGGGYGIMWNSNTSRWYATGGDGDNPNFNLQSSTDGLNWARVTTNVVFGDYWSAIAYNGTVWVGVGSDRVGPEASLESIFYSTDSINWSASQQTSGSLFYGTNVLWDGTRWWVTGSGGADAQTGGLFTSADGGVTFDVVQSVTTTGIAQIAYNGSYYLAVGCNAIWRYQFGGSWTQSVSAGIYTSVAWNGSFWVVTCSDPVTLAGSIQRSTDGINFTNSVSGGLTSSLTVSYRNLVTSAVSTATTITPSNLIVNNLPAVPYAGFGTVTGSGPALITLPYTYPNIPIVSLTVLNNYNPASVTGSVFPQLLFISSATTTNFTVGAYVWNTSAFATILGDSGAKVNFTFTVSANNSGTSYPPLSVPELQD